MDIDMDSFGSEAALGERDTICSRLDLRIHCAGRSGACDRDHLAVAFELQ